MTSACHYFLSRWLAASFMDRWRPRVCAASVIGFLFKDKNTVITGLSSEMPTRARLESERGNGPAERRLTSAYLSTPLLPFFGSSWVNVPKQSGNASCCVCCLLPCFQRVMERKKKKWRWHLRTLTDCRRILLHVSGFWAVFVSALRVVLIFFFLLWVKEKCFAVSLWNLA